MTCTVCENGFVNLHQIPESACEAISNSDDPIQGFLDWIENNDEHDVAVCHCCGNGENDWHSEPGVHDESTFGVGGPYEYNGGLPLCN